MENIPPAKTIAQESTNPDGKMQGKLNTSTLNKMIDP
jgi:hypothetical protein